MIDATLLPAVIQDARRRQRRRRVAVGALVTACAVAASCLYATTAGGPDAHRKTAGPHRTSPATPIGVPFQVIHMDSTPAADRTSHFRAVMAVLRRPRSRADVLPVGVRSWGWKTGVLGLSRRVMTPQGPVYLVPARTGCLWVSDGGGAQCDLDLEDGVYWNAEGSGSTFRIYGVASDAVDRIELLFGNTRRIAALRENVFSVVRPRNGVSAFGPYGTLVVHYRDGRPPTTLRLGIS